MKKETKRLAFSFAWCEEHGCSRIVGPASGDGLGGEEMSWTRIMTTDIGTGAGMTQRRLIEPPGQPRESCCPIECIPHSGADPIQAVLPLCQ